MVDGTGLENQQVNSLAGSNPVPSARKYKNETRRVSIFILFFQKKQDSSPRFVIGSVASDHAILSLN